MTTFSQGYQQAITDFEKLCSQYRDLNLKMKYPSSDKRYGSLQSLMKISMWNLMEIKEFLPYAQGNTSKLMKMFNLNPSDSIQFAKSIDIFLRAAFLSLFMFQVESLLKMIRNQLLTSPKDNYYNISKEVLKITHPTDWQQKHEILRIPALIRNCLHTSGVHTKDDEKLTVRGVEYEFKKDQMFNNASWDFIYIFIEELGLVLEEILSTAEVKKLVIPK